ncbi:hypothetical protein AAVH_28352 [Aphelenchoides avenae]|nr:hypothetical protein AAVH_28352 [Aphelenchus avenae]
MRPALEVVLEALQRQQNPEALTDADVRRIVSEELEGKKFWVHEASRVFRVKRISQDNGFEAEVRSQADVIARYAARYPRRPPLLSRAPHCPINMSMAAVFLWKRMPLQLPWWPLLVAKEANVGLWPLERAYIVPEEEHAPVREASAAAQANRNREGDGSGSGPAPGREGGAPGSRSSNGRPSLDDRVRQFQANGRFSFADVITGPDRGMIVEMPTANTGPVQARRIEVRCATATRLQDRQAGTSGVKPRVRSLVVIPSHSTFAGAPPPKKPRSDEKTYSYMCDMCQKFHKTSIPPHAHRRFCDCPTQWGLPSSSA